MSALGPLFHPKFCEKVEFLQEAVKHPIHRQGVLCDIKSRPKGSERVDFFKLRRLLPDVCNFTSQHEKREGHKSGSKWKLVHFPLCSLL